MSVFNKGDDFGGINVLINPSRLNSNYHSEQFGTFDNQSIICQQLRTHDIVRIDVGDVSFNVQGLRSAATYDAMFNALAQKTGKGNYYKVGPKATCALGYVAVYSWGDIGCRVDDFRITGAKGQDVEVNAIFEEISGNDIRYGFKKALYPRYDDSAYEEIHINGKANEIGTMNRYNRARFKVHIEVVVDDQIIYESNKKYITIYKRQDGKWGSDN